MTMQAVEVEIEDDVPDTMAINAVLAAAGYNFSLLLRWLKRLLRALIRILLATPATPQNA